MPKNCLIVGDFAIFMYSSGTLKIVQDHGHKNQGEIHLIKYRTVHEFSLAPLMRAPHKAVRSQHTRNILVGAALLNLYIKVNMFSHS